MCFYKLLVRKKHYLGTLENIQYVVSHEDSVKINIEKERLNEETEKLIKYKKELGEKGKYFKDWICFSPDDNAEFKGGINAFRGFIYNNFETPKNAKPGENLIRVTIGKQNNLEKAEVLKYTDEDTKKAIEEFFKLKELDAWHSAKLYQIPVKEQFEISLFMKWTHYLSPGIENIKIFPANKIDSARINTIESAIKKV